MVFCCCVSKGTVQEDAGELASIRAYSDSGCDSPYFHETELPPALAAAGVGADQWADVLEGAGTAVQFHWNPYTCVGTWMCCCFTHHKDIAPRARQFVEALNSGGRLPSGVVVRYQMQWERQIVAAGQGTGACRAEDALKMPAPQTASLQLLRERPNQRWPTQLWPIQVVEREREAYSRQLRREPLRTTILPGSRAWPRSGRLSMAPGHASAEPTNGCA